MWLSLFLNFAYRSVYRFFFFYFCPKISVWAIQRKSFGRKFFTCFNSQPLNCNAWFVRWVSSAIFSKVWPDRRWFTAWAPLCRGWWTTCCLRLSILVFSPRLNTELFPSFTPIRRCCWCCSFTEWKLPISATASIRRKSRTHSTTPFSARRFLQLLFCSLLWFSSRILPNLFDMSKMWITLFALLSLFSSM